MANMRLEMFINRSFPYLLSLLAFLFQNSFPFSYFFMPKISLFIV